MKRRETHLEFQLIEVLTAVLVGAALTASCLLVWSVWSLVPFL